jgi:hypothetical protein
MLSLGLLCCSYMFSPKENTIFSMSFTSIFAMAFLSNDSSTWDLSALFESLSLPSIRISTLLSLFFLLPFLLKSSSLSLGLKSYLRFCVSFTGEGRFAKESLKYRELPRSCNINSLTKPARTSSLSFSLF